MSQTKNMPKDGQVIMAIMKEMGITEYEPRTVIQLTEFVYRYGSTILEEARQFANNSNKRTLELDHVKLALSLQNESTVTSPPAREVVLEVARNRNNTALPLIKPPCGLRLPPDRHCLSSPNYLLKTSVKKGKGNFNSKANALKRGNFGINKQSVNIPRATAKVSNANMSGGQKTVLKPKIQITQNVQAAKSLPLPSNGVNELKRKREDDEEMM